MSNVLWRAWRGLPVLLAGVSALGLGACTAPPVSPPTPPGEAPAATVRPAHAYVERLPTGSIYQPSQGGGSLFAVDRRPRRVGDTLKVDIADKLAASRTLKTETGRRNEVATKGPGSKSAGGLLKKLLDIDVKASGSDQFEGKGAADAASSFTGQLSVTVVNVLPNGHLVIAGERSVTMNGGLSLLRFAGVVNPADVQPGNVVASVDVVNARIELAGEGEMSETASRTWLQKVLTERLMIW